MEKQIYVNIQLVGFGNYTQPLDALGILTDEIKEAAKDGDMSAKWEISFVELTEKEYDALPEFMGH